MTRSIFDFSRLVKLRQGRPTAPPPRYRDGMPPPTCTDTVTDTTDSHEGRMSPSLSHGSSEVPLPPLLLDEEYDKLLHRPTPATPKGCRHHSCHKKKPLPAQVGPLEPPQAEEHPPSHAVLLELQNSIDFLTTKLQQSESHVKALQEQNHQLRGFVDDFLKEQDGELFQREVQEEQAEEEQESGNDQQGAGLFGLKLQWPSFGVSPTAAASANKELESKEPNDAQDVPTIHSNNGPTDSISSILFTKEDAIDKMTSHYKEQVEKLVGEKNSMQTQLTQLKAQNKVQAETMASLEDQLRSDRHQHRNFFDHPNNRDAMNKQRPQSCRASSKSTSSFSSRQRRRTWQDLKQEPKREQQHRRESSHQDNKEAQERVAGSHPHRAHHDKNHHKKDQGRSVASTPIRSGNKTKASRNSTGQTPSASNDSPSPESPHTTPPAKERQFSFHDGNRKRTIPIDPQQKHHHHNNKHHHKSHSEHERGDGQGSTRKFLL